MQSANKSIEFSTLLFCLIKNKFNLEVNTTGYVALHKNIKESDEFPLRTQSFLIKKTCMKNRPN